MRALEIPETHEQQVAWLESELLGTELPMLAAQLAVVHGEPPEGILLNEETMVAVRHRGLSALSNEQFRRLLVDGEALMGLQRDVLQHGGAYWSNVQPPADSSMAAPLDLPPAVERSMPPRRGTPVASSILWAAVGSLTTAAALLLFANPFRGQPIVGPETAQTKKTVEPVDQVDSGDQLAVASSTSAIDAAPVPAWGFAKFARDVSTSETNLDPPLSREAYLRELATAAEAWKNKRPENPSDLAQRIGEFRMGCSAILLAEHRPLMESDRAWLQGRCRSWAAALDRHLAALENGDSVVEVTGKIDSTVTKIAAALLGRADTVAG